MERFHLDFHGLDYQLHNDLEDELMGSELPCPSLRGFSPGAVAQSDTPGQEPEDDTFANDVDEDFLEDEPDDPDHAGFPEEDEGACEDLCDIFEDDQWPHSIHDGDELDDEDQETACDTELTDEDPQDDATPADTAES